MQRTGDMSPALSRFIGYRERAEALERFKPHIRKGPPGLRARARRIVGDCEGALDGAWVECDLIGHAHGQKCAELVIRHYLLREDWHDISADLGIPYDKAKKMAYAAIKSLDRESEGRHADDMVPPRDRGA